MSFEISTLSKPTFRAIEPPNPRTFSHLRRIEYLVDQTGASWNRTVLWMWQLESLRRVSYAAVPLNDSRCAFSGVRCGP